MADMHVISIILTMSIAQDRHGDNSLCRAGLDMLGIKCWLISVEA